MERITPEYLASQRRLIELPDILSPEQTGWTGAQKVQTLRDKLNQGYRVSADALIEAESQAETDRELGSLFNRSAFLSDLDTHEANPTRRGRPPRLPQLPSPTEPKP